MYSFLDWISGYCSQFKDLMQTVADALEAAGVKAVQLRGTSHQKSNGLEAFHRESFQKVSCGWARAPVTRAGPPGG
jgi:hypothetical protein